MNQIEYKQMGDIIEGDVLLGSNGATAVTETYDVHIPEKMYRLRFGNNEVIEASGNHLWYTVTSLDKQTHKDRVKRAKQHVLPQITERKMNWLNRMSAEDQVTSPRVEAKFIFEVLDIGQSSNSSHDSTEYANQVIRVLESIGPVEIRNDYIYNETVHGHQSTREGVRMYSLSLFCEQMLALVKEALGEKHLHPYDLKVGKVRTTEQIMNTQDLGHEFPSTNPGSSGIFGIFKRR